MDTKLKQYFDTTISESRDKLLSMDVIKAQKILITAMGESLEMEGISEETKDYVFTECKKILKELLSKEEREDK